jgi:hypothetical protein
MKQQLKRKDLVKRMFMIPKEIDDWINDICNDTQESRSLVVTRFLTLVKNFQKNLEKS